MSCFHDEHSQGLRAEFANMQLVPDWVVGQLDYGAPNLSFALRARHFATSQNKTANPARMSFAA